jgi:mRNA interferase RelE/StbE
VRDEYELQLERSAERILARLPQQEHRRIEEAIDGLSLEPRPRGILKLQGAVDMYRLRVGNYRVIYVVFDQERIVKVLDVLRRDTQTYRRLDR